MKKIVYLLAVSCSLFAFEPGVYECKLNKPEYSTIRFALYPNFSARSVLFWPAEYKVPDIHSSGYWQDFGDSAVIITRNAIIEKDGDGFRTVYGEKCIKLEKKKETK